MVSGHRPRGVSALQMLPPSKVSAAVWSAMLLCSQHMNNACPDMHLALPHTKSGFCWMTQGLENLNQLPLFQDLTSYVSSVHKIIL